MSDYKWAAQVRAEEMAEREGREWDALTGDEQSRLYTLALQDRVERAIERYDMRKREE
jgi:hypothetical protein